MPKKYNVVRFKPHDDIIEALAGQMRKTPGLLRTALKRQGTRFKRRILGQLRVEPGPVRYPIQWKSEKQRRAFFATDGFGRGIPTPRTGDLARGWTMEADYSRDIDITVYNKKDYTRFVEGDDQQPFHKNTGWLYAPTILEDEQARFIDVVIETWFTVGDPTAGVF